MSTSEPIPGIRLTVDAGIASNISVGSFVVELISAGERPSSLDEELACLEEKYRSMWSTPADALEALKPARRLYHSFGIDPSKTRPVSCHVI